MHGGRWFESEKQSVAQLKAAGVATECSSPRNATVGAENATQLPEVLVENAIVIVMLVEDHLRLQSKLYSGKTTLTLHMIAVAQTLEGNVMLLEAEHTFDAAYPKPLCRDVEHLIICQPDKEEMAFELADSLCRSGAIHQICVDYVLALTPRVEIEDPLLVKAARGDPVNRLPAWMMRQAGRILCHEVGQQAAMLGFVGAPWTIATYIVEGGSTRTYTVIKRKCHTAPHVLKQLLLHLMEAISDYIVFQVTSGAHCIQIFDSWGGQLSPDMWDHWSKPYIKQIVDAVRKKYPKTPLVLYINGNGGLIERMKEIGVDVVGLDWTVDMEDGRKQSWNNYRDPFCGEIEKVV
ncbi:hypothetical protein Nepgr_010073 [Nepenthes gracilis]|uniref:Uroporphyrinogen decarboxylase (URO-D) domain-containing protein n=1 Tax=Nepenthes gracilis TaxID=150966 RepID=A0AAD3XKQ3_NEPGR|nr:hypothetical protein Nepgr_010073 [Nepenthes gracilis]